MATASYPVSIKGVLVRDNRVVLVRNDRAEWELPGGRIELGETPKQCVAREIAEETGLPVTVDAIIDSWMYHIEVAEEHVFIVTYGCSSTSTATPLLSHEHNRIAEFHQDEIADLPMPTGYKRSISTWFHRLHAHQTER